MQAGAGPVLPEAQRRDIDAMRAACHGRSEQPRHGHRHRTARPRCCWCQNRRQSRRRARRSTCHARDWLRKGRTFGGFGRVCHPIPSAAKFTIRRRTMKHHGRPQKFHRVFRPNTTAQVPAGAARRSRHTGCSAAPGKAGQRPVGVVEFHDDYSLDRDRAEAGQFCSSPTRRCDR